MRGWCRYLLYGATRVAPGQSFAIPAHPPPLMLYGPRPRGAPDRDPPATKAKKARCPRVRPDGMWLVSLVGTGCGWSVIAPGSDPTAVRSGASGRARGLLASGCVRPKWPPGPAAAHRTNKNTRNPNISERHSVSEPDSEPN